MKKGRLNNAELAKMARCYREINGLVALIPRKTKDWDEESALDCLVKARNGLGELLRWQDFGGAWQDAQEKETKRCD